MNNTFTTSNSTERPRWVVPTVSGYCNHTDLGRRLKTPGRKRERPLKQDTCMNEEEHWGDKMEGWTPRGKLIRMNRVLLLIRHMKMRPNKYTVWMKVGRTVFETTRVTGDHQIEMGGLPYLNHPNCLQTSQPTRKGMLPW